MTSTNLTLSQLKTLYYIRSLTGPWGDRRIEICIKDAAAELNLNRSTVSRCLKHLSQQGFIDMELIRVGVVLTAKGIKGYASDPDPELDPEECDRQITPRDLQITSCDRQITPSIYKYSSYFSTEEKDDYKNITSGSTQGNSTSLLEELENLYEAKDFSKDLFSAAGHQGKVRADGQRDVDATGHQGNVEAVSQKGTATAAGHQGDVEVVSQKGTATAAGHQGDVEAVSQKGTATAAGHQGDVEAVSQKGWASATGHRGKVTATGKGTVSAMGHRGKVSVNPLNQEATIQELWEIAPGTPFPAFLNWRAAAMRKQEGHWQENAYRFSYSEFYNNPTRTTAILWPEFLEAVQQVVLNSQQRQQAGMKVILPSWFSDTRPSPTVENAQQLVTSLQTLIEAGAEVALPQGVATPSCQQSLPYVEATKKSIDPLPVLQPTPAAPVGFGKKNLFRTGGNKLLNRSHGQA